MNTLIAHHVTTLILIRDLDAATAALAAATRSNGTLDADAVKAAESALLTHLRVNVLPTRQRVYTRIIGASRRGVRWECGNRAGGLAADHCPIEAGELAATPFKLPGVYRDLSPSRDFVAYAFCDDTDLAVNAHSWGIDVRQLVTDDDIAAACKAWAHKLRVYMDDTFIADIIAHMRKTGKTYWAAA